MTIFLVTIARESNVCASRTSNHNHKPTTYYTRTNISTGPSASNTALPSSQSPPPALLATTVASPALFKPGPHQDSTSTRRRPTPLNAQSLLTMRRSARRGDTPKVRTTRMPFLGRCKKTPVNCACPLFPPQSTHPPLPSHIHTVLRSRNPQEKRYFQAEDAQPCPIVIGCRCHLRKQRRRQ